MARKNAKARPAPKPVPVSDGATALVLDRLWTVIVQRRNADPAISHSARLLSRGTAKVAQKFGEEAVECLIEAVSGNAEALVAESADVLYHLLVVWVAAGIEPAVVWAELKRREGISGIAEKAARALPAAARTSPKAAKPSPKMAKSPSKAAKSSPKMASKTKVSPKAAKTLPTARAVGTRKIP